ncbi:LemA family protein [candidate division WWE3 bacterium]|nr:LemA family protein [candidate division WWE3 bacterium]
MQLFLIPLGILALIALYLIGIYNKLAKLKVRIDEAWSQIDVQLKRRADLIPNLVETVKGYASHEKGVFQQVTEARSALMSASNVKEAGQADQQLQTALKSLFAVAEAYPELKAQEGFTNLQRELSDTEDKVAYSRQFYNAVVRDFNTMLATFPTNVVGNMLGYSQREFFEASEEERKNVEVDF